MALDSELKRRVEEWWASKIPPATRQRCPGCDWSAVPREAVELAASPQAVALVCPGCGHAHIFLVSAALENRLPPRGQP
jgi:cell wall assembly regulator SMI1